MRPVAAIYSTFLQRSYDQVLHDVCIQNLPVIFALDRAGLVGADGPTHHGVFDLAYLRSLPNMVVMAPKDENELQSMVKTALVYEGGPIAFRYPRGTGVGVKMALVSGEDRSIRFRELAPLLTRRTCPASAGHGRDGRTVVLVLCR